MDNNEIVEITPIEANKEHIKSLFYKMGCINSCLSVKCKILYEKFY